MKEYLLLISIGPVQDYIASARKLRDLWFGSYLLSELSKGVAKTLYEQGAELIFPFIKNKEKLEKNSDLIVANKIFAKVNSDPQVIIDRAKSQWKKEQVDFALTALDKIKSIKSIKIDEELFKQQIGDSSEFYAAWVEINESYIESKDKLEKILAGRKNLRNFNKSSWNGEGLLKSGLDGLRETVFIGKQKEIKGLIKKNEYLDTLGCIKRFYPLSNSISKRHFDDLSDIALIPYIEKIKKNKELMEMLNQYESCFSSTEEGLRLNRNEKINLKIISDMLYVSRREELSKVKEPKKAWKKLKKLINNENAGEPPKYAAVLMGDGDKMGAALDKITTIEGHQLFSEALSEFSNDVEKIIENYQGSLIYAGGDDVLAYIPLHNALVCADEVRKAFHKRMTDIFNQLNIDVKIPTFSIGLAIVHHSAPLSSVLDLVRQAEAMAKNDAGRNALSIIQSKRGGGNITVFGKWTNNDKNVGIVERLMQMIKLYNNEKKILPNTLGYQLRQARLECGDEMNFEVKNGQLIPLNSAAVSVIRIFEHKKESEELKIILNGRTSIRKLSDELVVARQIAEISKMVYDMEVN